VNHVPRPCQHESEGCPTESGLDRRLAGWPCSFGLSGSLISGLQSRWLAGLIDRGNCCNGGATFGLFGSCGVLLSINRRNPRSAPKTFHPLPGDQHSLGGWSDPYCWCRGSPCCCGIKPSLLLNLEAVFTLLVAVLIAAVTHLSGQGLIRCRFDPQRCRAAHRSSFDGATLRARC